MAFRTIDPELAVKAMTKANLTPQEVFPGSIKKWRCICEKCGNEVFPTYNAIQQGRGGCGFCAGKKIHLEDAVALMMNAGLRPIEAFKNKSTSWKSECLRCGDIVSPKLEKIMIGQKGCKSCGHTATGLKRRLKNETIRSAMEDAFLQPLEPYKNIQSAWKCLCLKCGKTVSPRFKHIMAGHSGCVYCSGVQIDHSDAIEFMLKNKIRPLEPYKSAVTSWKSECMRCGRKVEPTYSSVQSGSIGCGYCAGNRIDAEVAETFMRDLGIEPLEPYSSGHLAWKCRCLTCGNEISPKYSNVRSGQGACRFCATKGIDYNKPAYLYFMHHKDFDSLKIGISNSEASANRIKIHTKFGWTLIEKHDFLTAKDAEIVEQNLLKWIRNEKNLPVHLIAELMPQGGFTETVDALEISVPELRKKLKEVLTLLK
jgi:rRNA maturation endonuclease Nob1